ncbi:phosphotransferase [Frankia sp. Cpl3]|nr:phosphotransferase [Frankia sp. Cpl3]
MANYTTADQVDLDTVSQHYGLADIQISPLRGGAANSSFHLFSDSGEFTLTVLDNHNISSARRLAAHTQTVFGLGIPTTEVVPTIAGDLVAALGSRPTILKRWISGEVRDPLPLSLLPAAGNILASIHQLTAQAAGLSDVPSETRRLSPVDEAAISQFMDENFGGWLSEQMKKVHALEEERKGIKRIVHGDLFADNIIVGENGQLSVLDWETISLDDPLLDLGMAIVGLGQRDGLLATDRMDLLISGYREVEELNESDLVALPIEIVNAALIIAYHRYVRHNIRFPDPSKSGIHVEMIKFVDSVEKIFQL